MTSFCSKALLILLIGSSLLSPGARAGNLAHVTAQSPVSLELTFDSPSTRTISYRADETSGSLKTLTDVQETTYNLINLLPGTRYHIEIGSSGDAAPTSTLAASTGAYTPPARYSDSGYSHQLSLEQPLGTFADNVWYPTVEYYQGKLWLVESYKGQLYLSQMDAVTSAVLHRQVIVPQPHPGRETYTGIMDTAIHNGKLWIIYNEQDTNNPAGYDITQSRQKILSYDFETGALSPTVTVEPMAAGRGTWEGGIDVLAGQLWTACLDVWLENGKRRTKVVMRTFDGKKFGQPVPFETCPTAYPYGPSISPAGGKLVLLFSDLIPYESDKNREPLYCATFDGQAFGEAKLIFNEGRNRYAKGVQMGNSFVLAWKSNAGWWQRFGYMYHDILVAHLDVATGKMSRPDGIKDRKYNSSPDLTLVAPDHAVMVYGKFEHEYTRSDVSFNYGSFRVDLQNLPVSTGH